MTPKTLPIDRPGIRGADSNTLLRLYDRAIQAVRTTDSQLERRRADKSARRIAQELRRRQVIV
jgi:hypothetical protein